MICVCAPAGQLWALWPIAPPLSRRLDGIDFRRRAAAKDARFRRGRHGHASQGQTRRQRTAR
eukprot:3379006-Pleurochrysis_carterae.AAC.1